MDYKELSELINSDAKNIISTLKNGRIADLPDFKKAKDEIEPLGHLINDHTYRKDKDVKIDKPDGSTQKKTEKVARISLALQSLIVKRAVAFLFGNEPLLNTSEEYTNILDALKRVFADCKINSINRRTAKNLLTYQDVAEYWYVEQSEEESLRYGFPTINKIRCAIFSPNDKDFLYPFFDDNNDMIAFSREYTISRTNVSRTFFETWTKDFHYRWENKNNDYELCEGYPLQNPIGKIPVIYAHQDKTEWEDVQNLIDRLEKLLSNFADTNDYHASPKIFIQGQVEGFAQKGETGAILQGEQGSSAQYLSWSQAPESVKTEIDTLLKMIYTISQTPDISFESVKSLGAVSGVALRLMFMDAHLKVQEKAEIFDEFLQRRINVILAYLSKFNIKDEQFTNNCKNAIITPEIQPYLLEDDATKISELMTATGNKAIAARITAIKKLGWVSDADKEEQRIEEDENGNNMADLMTPTM